jgi:hypothetical protein
MTFVSPSSRTVYNPERGKLYDFTPKRVIVIGGFPPLAWKKTEERPVWTPCRPHIQIPKKDFKYTLNRYALFSKQIKTDSHSSEVPYEEVKRKLSRLACLRWYDTIPYNIRPLIAKYPNRQWHILSFMLRCGDAAFDLVQSNPALAYALSSNWVFRNPPVKQPLRSARSLLKPGKKQRDILQWLGFPGTQWMRKIFRKIHVKSLTIPMLLSLQQVIINRDIAKVLSHLPLINSYVVHVLEEPRFRAMVTYNFLVELANPKRRYDIYGLMYMINDICEANDMLGRQRPIRLDSMDQFNNYHEEIIYDLNDKKDYNYDISFPLPPIDGTEDIIPITTPKELAEESKLQRHCGMSYVSRIVRGSSYLYKVLAPERATLSLEKSDGKWRVGQLLKENNKPVSKDTYHKVTKWLILNDQIDAIEPDSRVDIF